MCQGLLEFIHCLRRLQGIPANLMKLHGLKLYLTFFFTCLLLILPVCQVFGALWYFFSIERETVCWKSACRKHAGCNHGSFYCDDHSGDYTFLNEFCPIKPQNTKIFDFGIFHDALESGIVEMTDFPQKLLHCFFWGLQSLRFLHTQQYSKSI